MSGGAAEPLAVVIVGAGFSGLAMAIRCLEAGIGPLRIVEKAGSVGGVWRENTYPGAACDIPGHLYALSFAPKDDWSRLFPTQPEIAAYLEEVVARFGLRPHLSLDTTVTGAVWDEARALWRIETDRGPLLARALVSGAGGLHHPALPDIPGRDSFAGPAFHSAAWDHGVSLAGRRVGVIGTGASAIQIVPAIAPEVASLTLFQRSPPWVMPRNDHVLGPRVAAAFGRWPLLRRAFRGLLFGQRELPALLGFTRGSFATRIGEFVARRHLHQAVADPALRARLTPRYRLGCKRVLVSDDYYPALTRPNVAVEAGAIRAITPRGVVTGDGVEHALDVIVFATGFDLAAAGRLPVTGRGGITLDAAWAGGMGAHRGITLAGFPNHFFLLGPNTGLGHNSVVLMIEAQVAYVLACLERLAREPGVALEPAPEAQARFLADLQARLAGSIWQRGGCVSWYQDAAGRNVALWPGTVASYRRSVRTPLWDEFVPARVE
ncbi:MAG: NAD(P)/FAD-dependent oxidoreductase [Methylobacterium frigidaeris]